MRLAMKVTGWIPVPFLAHVHPFAPFYPVQKASLSAVGMGSVARIRRVRRLGMGSHFGLGVVVVCVEGIQYPHWDRLVLESAENCVRGILH